MSEGYIKFEAEWVHAEAPPADFLEEVIAVRQQLHALGLIGAYPDGIGFGNISKRWDAEGRFAISGTATGGKTRLSPSDFCLVTIVDTDRNWLRCQGPIMASSESMSHAAIYGQCPDVGGVIHIHHLGMWAHWFGRAPTTPEAAAYGTPAMARAIARIVADPELRKWGFLVMGGHREGCIAFGADLEEAFSAITSLLDKTPE